MTPGTLRLLVWVLAAVTAVLLAVTSTTLVGQWRERASATAGAPGPVLERHGVRLRLPGPAEVLPPRERLLYRDSDGRVAAAVRGAALLVPGACADVPGSSRGFVGVVRARGTSAAAHDLAVREWTTGLAAAVGEQPEAVEVVRQYVRWGAGPRAGQALLLCGKARALLDGRATVSLDDIRALAAPVLRHRVLVNFQAEAEGVSPHALVERLLAAVPAATA